MSDTPNTVAKQLRQTSLICPLCRDLVPVVDKTIADHGECPASGTRYVPSPRVFRSGPGGPSFELLASKPVTLECGSCGKDHKGQFGIVKVTVPNAANN